MIFGTYYKTATECPLSVFIAVVVLGDIKRLKRAGIVSISRLEDAYNSIFDEYLQGSNSDGYAILLSQLKDVALLRAKARLAGCTLEVLKMKNNHKLVEVLRMLGYRYDFNHFEKEKYYSDLEKVAKDVKKMTEIIQGMEQKFRDKAKGGVTEADFDSLLVQLGKYQGYRLEKDKVTVSEFVQVLKNYKRDNKPKT
jgi:hypothetical protein